MWKFLITRLRLARRIVGSSLGFLAMLVATQADAQACTVSMTECGIQHRQCPSRDGGRYDRHRHGDVLGRRATVRACVSIALRVGLQFDEPANDRSGSTTARYDLYSNSTRTTLWGSWQTGYDTAGVQM